MLHLFNKVYLEFDERLDINFDRVVISEQHGVKMYEALDKVAQGELLAFGKTYEDVVIGDDMVGFVTSLKDFSKSTNLDRKIIIYCDQLSFKKFSAAWLKMIMPNLTKEGFATIMKHVIYNQRVISNTQLASVHSLSIQAIWDGVDDMESFWETAYTPTEDEIAAFKSSVNLNLSYEYLMANYLSGDTRYKEELRKTMQMFMRRWLQECFTDNRQMVLLNLTNHKFLSTFDIDPSTVDITSVDPLANIEFFKMYADDEIWESADGVFGQQCKIAGVSNEKLDAIYDTLTTVYDKFEGMEMDTTLFAVARSWLKGCAAPTLTDEVMESVIEYVVEKPFDTNLIPRFDFQNVNFPLFLYFLGQKHKGEDLTEFRLL